MTSSRWIKMVAVVVCGVLCLMSIQDLLFYNSVFEKRVSAGYLFVGVVGLAAAFWDEIRRFFRGVARFFRGELRWYDTSDHAQFVWEWGKAKKFIGNGKHTPKETCEHYILVRSGCDPVVGVPRGGILPFRHKPRIWLAPVPITGGDLSSTYTAEFPVSSEELGTVMAILKDMADHQRRMGRVCDAVNHAVRELNRIRSKEVEAVQRELEYVALGGTSLRDSHPVNEDIG